MTSTGNNESSENPENARSGTTVPSIREDVASEATVSVVPDGVASATVKLKETETTTVASAVSSHGVKLEEGVSTAMVRVKEEREVPEVTSSSLASTPQQESRKRTADDADSVPGPRKRRKTERDFHLDEVENCLRWARRYADEGNRFMMEFNLREATQHAEKAGASDAAFLSRLASIRCSMRSERDFHLGEVKDCLRLARKNADKGDRFMMEFNLNDASKHAEKAGASDAAFLSRLASIRSSMHSERDFHLVEVEGCLRLARKYADKGDRFMMEFNIREATQHAEKAGASDATFLSRLASIRSSMRSERDFHLGEVEDCLSLARKYADKGDRFMMEFNLREATQHAKKAAIYGDAFLTRASAIRSILDVAVVKIE